MIKGYKNKETEDKRQSICTKGEKRKKIRALTADQKKILYITFKGSFRANRLDTIRKVIPVKSTLVFKGVTTKVSNWSLQVEVAAASSGTEAEALVGNKFGAQILRSSIEETFVYQGKPE